MRNPSLLQVGSAPVVWRETVATRRKVMVSTLAAAVADESLRFHSSGVTLDVFAAAVASRTMSE